MKFQEPPARVLVVRLSALGDVVNCLPALDALRELWPGASLEFLCETAGSGVLAGHAHVHRTIAFPRKRWEEALRSPRRWLSLILELLRFVRELRRSRYDLVVDFQGNTRSLVLYALARGGPRVTHHPSEVKELAHLFARTPAKPAGRVLRAEKHLHLVRWLGWSGSAPASFSPIGLRTGTGSACPNPGNQVYLHPFVSRFGEIKAWPVRHFLRLARLLSESSCTPVFGWGPGEREAAADLVRRAGGNAQLAPVLADLGEFISYLRSCSAVVAADTGPLHIASMAGVPAIGLYGPKDPAIYAPWRDQGRVLRSKTPCSPCTLRRCEHRVCMELIQPERVHEAVLGAVSRGRLQPKSS